MEAIKGWSALEAPASPSTQTTAAKQQISSLVRWVFISSWSCRGEDMRNCSYQCSSTVEAKLVAKQRQQLAVGVRGDSPQLPINGLRAQLYAAAATRRTWSRV